MKIAECVIQERMIEENTEKDFVATYKGNKIYITRNHGHGILEYPHLRRYDIDVIDIKSGLYDVQTYEDCHDMRNAIIVALKGAGLIE